jgi:hypothetical protein
MRRCCCCNPVKRAARGDVEEEKHEERDNEDRRSSSGTEAADQIGCHGITIRVKLFPAEMSGVAVHVAGTCHASRINPSSVLVARFFAALSRQAVTCADGKETRQAIFWVRPRGLQQSKDVRSITW